MIRGLASALLGLSLLSGPAAARGDGPAGDRRAEVAGLAAIAGAKAERSPLLRRVSHARPAVPSGGSASCGRAGGGVLRCRGTAAASRSWAQGLPPPLHVQTQACPAGTMATLAQGHDDVVRCIPI